VVRGVTFPKHAQSGCPITSHSSFQKEGLHRDRSVTDRVGREELQQCQISGSHFILSGFNYDVLILKDKYNVLIVLMLYCKTLLLLLRWDTGRVRDRCGGMGRFRGGFKYGSAL